MPSWGLEQWGDCRCSAVAANAWQRTHEPLLPGPGALQMFPPESWNSTPHAYPRAPPLVTDGFPAGELVGLYHPWGLSVAQEGSLHLCLQLPTLSKWGLLLLCCLLWQRLLVCSASWEALSPSRLGCFHYNSLPLRMPSSTCVGMTHLALAVGESLSLMKRYWPRMPQAHFQPLPG